jgi:hypothetical protein
MTDEEMVAAEPHDGGQEVQQPEAQQPVEEEKPAAAAEEKQQERSEDTSIPEPDATGAATHRLARDLHPCPHVCRGVCPDPLRCLLAAPTPRA